MKSELSAYKEQLEEELDAILSYWIRHTIDEEHGGFFGKIDHADFIHKEAPKGSVLNSRILWAFSAAHRHSLKEEYLKVANRAYEYLMAHFVDREQGGIYWTVDYKGNPLDTKKQIYALSFGVYGLSEYYRCNGLEEAREQAIDLYRTIVHYSHDGKKGGYIEALTRDWKEISDLRLSTRDRNEKKTMNTHLHLLEGFANLYRIWPDAALKEHIIELIQIFSDRIIDKETAHLILFFDEDWNPKSNIISYGHDIEAAWLIQEAAELMDDEELLHTLKENSVKMAKAAAKGLDQDGGLWYEYDKDREHLIREKHSWPQGEAMVGFFNAWQNTGEEAFLQLSIRSWQFAHRYIIDKAGGEWHWGVTEDYAPMQEDKAGLWKCPYHNSRACMEIIRRISVPA